MASPASAQSAGGPVPAKYDPAVVNPWGIWADLAGTSWIDAEGKTTYVYAWKVPGEVMTSTVTGPSGTFSSTFELDADGTTVNILRDPKVGGAGRFTSPRPGVSVQTVPGNSTERIVYRYLGDEVTATSERLQDGAWVPQQTQARRRATADDLARVARSSAEAVAANQAKAEAEQAKQAAAQAELERQWGVLAKIAGSDWQGDAYVQVWWIEKGRKLAMNWYDRNTLQQINWFRFVRDDKSGSLLEESTYYPHEVLADGTVYTTYGLNRGWYMHPDGRFTLAKGDARDGQFLFKKDYTTPMTRLDPAAAKALDVRIAQVAEAEKRAQAANSGSSGGGSMLGSLLGATVGAAVASAAGGNAEQVVGGAFKGASVVNADSEMGSALSQAGDQFLGQSTGAGALGALAAGTGPTAQASFPTKPNLATSACAGFTESNYRTKALEGGPDTQLLTMCGQAFEYYTMYKRAISQGYSEADCNRTYAAHEQSARVASSYANGG